MDYREKCFISINQKAKYIGISNTISENKNLIQTTIKDIFQLDVLKPLNISPINIEEFSTFISESPEIKDSKQMPISLAGIIE